MSRAYYNEIDPYCAQWLRNLIEAGHIPAGDVDERSIVDVAADDLKGYRQCHLFAGLGGWSRALRLSGWPDDRPVWTGSCPCQPFSVAGSRKGFDDSRHLWPQFHRLIAQRCPPVVFGEQVANAAAWLAGVRGDLETLGYAVGAMPVEAASAGADHYRDRFWFVADYDFQCSGEGWSERGGELGRSGGDPQDHHGALPFSDHAERRADGSCGDDAWWQEAQRHEGASDAPERRSGPAEQPEGTGWGKGWTEHEFRSRGFTAAVASLGSGQFVECPDGKWRRLPPPGVRWLGTRLPARVAKLRAIGNAIDPRPAAQVIGAYLDLRSPATLTPEPHERST